MKTLEQLTGTNDFKTNILAFVLLGTVAVLFVAFTVLAIHNGINNF